ncbi:MAG: 3-oxo-5-alpha-steroid 4-dehydrogenase [Acidobacteriota bacterium]|nr:3-oxo-5-alpha-steroid 4-dehydrogenase [Acidobacteriota bacterium]
MTELEFHRLLVWAMLGVAAVTLWYLFRRTAPYGRHYGGSGWGPDISSKVGWVVMEWPAVLFFLSVYVQGNAAWNVVPLVFLTMWQVHYVHRTFIYPFRTRTSGHTPLLVVMMGLAFNVVNAYINARLVSELGEYGASWLSDPRFVVGTTVFVSGMILNLRSDGALIRLRKNETTEYGIPRGWAFRYVSCPNYLGEIIEWTGWAIATWSLAGLSFAVFTFANLAPRAVANHRWYRQKFPDYPSDRRALIPGVW